MSGLIHNLLAPWHLALDAYLGTPKSETWLESKNNQQFFAPNDISFINKLASSDTLVFQWEPYSSSTRAVKFELTEFHKDLKKLSDFGCFVIE